VKTPMNDNSILLIEDNPQLQKYIGEYLSAYGYSPFVLTDYGAVVETIECVAPRLILLDITLPKFDGFYYLKLIRRRFDMPIIILTARSEEAEQIRGIEGGADDYVTKPFSAAVLMAKIGSMLKKTSGSGDALKAGRLTLSPAAMTAANGDKSVELSKNEYRVLRLLVISTGNIVTREQLLEELWDDAAFVDNNTLNVNMTRVKGKLRELGFENAIVTKRGVGYALDTSCL
jgi:DNA-binding response OmpR family regulator